MARPSKFVKIREVLQGEIAKYLNRQITAVNNENYAEAAIWKEAKEMLTSLQDITNEGEIKHEGM